MQEEITRREVLKRSAVFGGAALIWVKPSISSYAMSTTLAARASGASGCTPGFWKNNPGRWPSSVSPSDLVPWTALYNSQPTFQEALEYGGGGGDAGAERNLFRAAAAGHLNAKALSGYQYSTGQIASLVSEAQSLLAGGDRDGAMAIASSIDTENNAGCPLPADESHEEITDESTPDEPKELEESEVFGEDEPVEEEKPSEDEEASGEEKKPKEPGPAGSKGAAEEQQAEEDDD